MRQMGAMPLAARQQFRVLTAAIPKVVEMGQACSRLALPLSLRTVCDRGCPHALSVPPQCYFFATQVILAREVPTLCTRKCRSEGRSVVLRRFFAGAGTKLHGFGEKPQGFRRVVASKNAFDSARRLSLANSIQ